MSWYKFAASVCVFAAVTIANAETRQGQSNAAPPAGVRDPGDPRVAVTPVEYRSAFSRYRPNVEAEVGSWREKNDDVGRIGGWRVYGREASPETNAVGKPSGDAEAARNVTPRPAQGHQHPGAK